MTRSPSGTVRMMMRFRKRKRNRSFDRVASRSLAVLGVQGMPFVFVFVSVFVGSDRKFRDARLKGTRPREKHQIR